MATKKKQAKKKSSKKTSKKASRNPKKQAKSEGQALPNIEDMRRAELVNAVSELAVGVEDGSIKGLLCISIVEKEGENDRLRFAGARPQARVEWLLKLAERFLIDEYVRLSNQNQAQ